MIKGYPFRWAWLGVILFALLAGPAWAQNKPPKKDVKETKKKKKKKSGLKVGPTANLDSFQSKLLMDKRVRAAQEQISKLRQNSIASLRKILRTSRTLENKGRIYFQLGELLWQEKKYRFLLSYQQYEKQFTAFEEKRLTVKPKEPKEDYSEALVFYRKVLKEAPNYARIDEVIYYLGRGLLKTKDKTKQKEGIERLKMLVKKYAKSRFVPEAHLQMAEWMFKNKNLGGAQYHYEKLVNNYKKSSIYNYAQYKLGWVYYNLGEYQKAITTLKNVVSYMKGKTSRGMIEFRDQALKDMIVIHTKIDDGWQKLKDYFLPMIGKKKTYNYLEKMAALYEGNDQDEEASQLYAHFIQREKTNPKCVSWWESIIDIEKKSNVFVKTEQAMRKFIRFFDPKGSWMTSNRQRAKLVTKATNMSAQFLAFIGTTYHVKAQKDNNKALYQKAADTYKEYFSKYPNRKKSYELNFYYAEILLEELKQVDAAIAQYRRVIELDKKGKYLAKSAEGLIYSYFNKMVKAGLRKAIYPTRKKIKKGKIYQKGRRGKTKVKNREKVKIKVKALHKLEREYVKAADLYVKLLPKDKRVPEMMYISAETFYMNGQWKDAIKRLQIVVSKHGKHEYAAYAGNALLDCYKRLEDWKNIERWAKVLIASKNFKVKKKKELQKFIAIARTEQAGKFEKERRYDSAITTLNTIIRDFRGNKEVLEKTIFNKAELLLRAKRVAEAIKTFQDFLRRFKKSDLTPRAMSRVALIYESQTEFTKAAQSFEKAAELYKKFDKYKKTKKSGDNLYNAGLIYEAIKDWTNAARVYSTYIKNFKSRGDVVLVALKIGYALEHKKDWKAAAKTYMRLTKDKRFRKAPAQLVEAYTRAGYCLQKTSGKRTRKKVLKLYDSALKLFISMVSQKMKPAVLKKAKRYAAMAAFEKSEYVFRDFSVIKLELPMKKIAKNLKKRAELMLAAQKLYFEAMKIKYGQYSAASAYRIGQMYYDFAESLFNVPLPKGLTPDQEDKYKGFLEDKAEPLRDKALKAFRSALKLAHDNRVYNKWSLLSGKYLTKLSPESFPLAKEDAVKPNKKKDIIASGNFIRSIKRGEFTVNFSKK